MDFCQTNPARLLSHGVTCQLCSLLQPYYLYCLQSDAPSDHYQQRTRCQIFGDVAQEKGILKNNSQK